MTKVRELITGIGLTSSLNLPRLRVREMTFQRKREGDLDAREIIYIYIYKKTSLPVGMHRNNYELMLIGNSRR